MGEPFIGQITMVGFNFAPPGWAKCDGAVLPISQNPALYALVGTKFGGDGVTNFALPDMRGRVPLHRGILQQDRYGIGQRAGSETVQLSLEELPQHNHPLMASQDASNSGAPSDTRLPGTQVESAPDALRPLYNTDSPSTALAADAIGSAGEGGAHDNVQPIQVVNFIIATAGIFPPRN